MAHPRISVAILCVLAALAGCGRDAKQDSASGPKSFEDFSSRIEQNSQVFANPKHEHTPPSEKEKALKVGLIAPLTGEDAATGRMTIEGVEIAAGDFNRSGGVGGKGIEVIKADDGGDPEKTREAVRSLTEKNVVAIIGAPTGWSTLVPVYISTETETLFISAGTRRRIGSSGPFSFKVSLPIDSASEELVEYCVSRGKKDFFLVSATEDEFLSVSGALRRAAHKKGASVKGQSTMFSAKDVPEAVRDLKKSMPVDGVMFAGPPDLAIDFLKQAKSAGMTVPIIGGEELQSPEFLKGGELVKGSLIYSGFYAGDREKRTSDFVEKYRQKTGKPPSVFAASAYDAFMVLGSAIKNAGSTKPSEVRQAMMSVDVFSGVAGKLSIGQDREAARKAYLLKATAGEGAAGFVIVKNPHD